MYNQDCKSKRANVVYTTRAKENRVSSLSGGRPDETSALWGVQRRVDSIGKNAFLSKLRKKVLLVGVSGPVESRFLDPANGRGL